MTLLMLVCATLVTFGALALAGPDCNDNGVADDLDISSESSTDCDANGVPDECDTAVAFVPNSIEDGFVPQIEGGDLDGDGDPDIVAALFNEDLVVWFENLGAGEFGSRQIVAALPNNPIAVALSDLDGDGDLDIVAGTLLSIDVVWYENLDGGGSFGSGQAIEDQGPVDSAGVSGVITTDLDSDGDMDVIATAAGIAGPDFIAWYENLDGLGGFGPRQQISDAAAQKLVAVDIDGDFDLDLVAGSEAGAIWFEHLDGDGAFGPSTPLDSNACCMVATSDVDGDGDVDVLLERVPSAFGWAQNLDGGGNYGTFQEIRNIDPISAVAGDLDNDGDEDVIWGSSSGGALNMAWHENLDGAGTFGPRQFVSSMPPYSLSIVDVDGDFDNDLLAGMLGTPGGVLVFVNTSNDCNANAKPDSCDIATSFDCNLNAVPDVCETSCVVDCDLDSDGCLAGVDCDPSNASAWSASSPVDSLMLDRSGGTTMLSWQAPSHPGASSVFYDVLSSSQASGFGSATCVETDLAVRSAVDSTVVPSGGVTHFLVRVENACPGSVGSIGADSSGSPRDALTCP